MRILPQSLPQINFRPLQRDFFIWLGAGMVLFGFGKIADLYVFHFLEAHVRNPHLDRILVFLTERFIWVVLGAFALSTGWRLWKKPGHRTKLLPAFFALAATAIMGTVFKSMFGVPRPFEVLHLQPMVSASLASFPSLHTALAFALVIPFFRISKWIGGCWILFALAVGAARVYENVHFPSDIAGGIFVGGVIGSIFSNPETEKILQVLWKDLEFRRQSFHFLAGFGCVFAHWIGVFGLREISILLVLGLVLSRLSVGRKIPFISDFLKLVDRPRDYNFPGKGSFYFLLGVFLTFLIFDVRIAYASILILAVGDSLNHLFAIRTPKTINLPWNRRKSLLGVLSGIAAGTFAAHFFVPVLPAFFAAGIAILGETMPMRIGNFYIDDNVTVPLIAGTVLVATM